MCRPILAAISLWEGRTRVSPSSKTSTGSSVVVQPGGGHEPARLGVSHVEPAVGDAVAGHEVPGGVRLRGEPVTHQAQARLGEPCGGVRLPVLHQVVEHRVQPGLRWAPGLHQVVVEAELVDRPDGGLGVRVGGEEHALGQWSHLQGAGQELDAGHPRHALVGDQERHGLAPADDLLDQADPRLARVGQQDAVARAVPVPQVALDRPADRRVVVDGQDERAHGGRGGHPAES